MTIAPDAPQRVRTTRPFHHWKQTPGTIIDVDNSFGLVKIRFDNGVEAWVAAKIVESIT